MIAFCIARPILGILQVLCNHNTLCKGPYSSAILQLKNRRFNNLELYGSEAVKPRLKLCPFYYAVSPLAVVCVSEENFN